MSIRNIFKSRWGLTFTSDDGSWHTGDDLGLLPASPPDFGTPTVKQEIVEIPGTNGAIDLTEWAGYPTYGTRPGSFEYYLPDRRESQQRALHARVTNLLHGRVWKITPDENPDAYYTGRLSVGPIVRTGTGMPTFKITGDLDPFRTDWADPSTDSWQWDPFSFENGVIREYGAITISGETEVTVVSSPVGGTPLIKNNGSAAMTLETEDGDEYTLPAGEWTSLGEIELPHAFEEVTWTITGSGTVTIYFRTGGF